MRVWEYGRGILIFSYFHILTLPYLPYSVFKLFVGFATAARIAWKLTVMMAIQTAIRPASANIHQLMGVRYANAESHLFMAHQAMGVPIIKDNRTSFTKSFDKSWTIPLTLAPSTLRMPISLLLCSALNEASPNKPSEDIKIAIRVNELMILPSVSSDSYCFC